MKSFLSHLECTATGETFSADEPHTLSPNAQKVLYPRYDLEAAKAAIDPNDFAKRPSNMWRFFELMPLRDESKVVTMGEGVTPMLRARRLEKTLDAKTLFIKDEGVNPTGSFKARGLSAAVSKANELGLRRLTVPSAGNAAGALAAYAAKAGMEAYVFMPKDAPDMNKRETRWAGAELTLVEGLISDAGKLSREKAAELDLFDV
ncbi:MAG: pyridoxal-phosphate dependent enzyme, partial [Dehalococcoidia bacterium]